MARARLGAEAAGERLAEEVARWRAAYEGWQGAVKQSELRLVRAEQRVLGATGGLGLARWWAACRRKRITTVQDARLKAKALRAGPAVERALAERARARAEGDALVLVARLALADASKRLASYGSLGAELAGLSPGQLRRLARRPAQSVPKDHPGPHRTGQVIARTHWRLRVVPQVAAPEEVPMPVRPEVRQAQRTIAALDAAHRQAAARLEEALARRAEAIADQDHLVSVAQAALGRAVADMAHQLSAELAAQLVGLGLAEVRRLAKAHPGVAAGDPAGAGTPAHAVRRSS